MTLMLILEFQFSKNQLESVSKFYLLSATSTLLLILMKLSGHACKNLGEDCGEDTDAVGMVEFDNGVQLVKRVCITLPDPLKGAGVGHWE